MNPIVDLQFLLNFEVEQSVMEERMLERAKTSGRSDDNPETIKKRLTTFHTLTKPIIDFYSKKNQVVTINADGSIDEVFGRVQE